MKSGRGQFPGAAERPDPRVRVYLFHGADESGSRALAGKLLTGLSAEKQVFTSTGLKSDPGSLVAEACAISMFGGKRLLWVEPAGDEVVPAAEAVLAADVVDHPVAILAGALKKTSALLKLAEAHPLALAHASYVPEGREADRMVAEIGHSVGLRIRPPLAASIAAQAANDRAIVTQELTKFALYLDAAPERPKDLDEEVVELLSADSSESDNGRAGDLALEGALDQLAQELEQLESSGIDAIPAVRTLQRRLIMLAGLRARMDGGQRLDAVLASAWKRDKAVATKALPRWSSSRLAEVFGRVAKLERQLLLLSPPDRAALGEELIQIARATRR